MSYLIHIHTLHQKSLHLFDDIQMPQCNWIEAARTNGYVPHANFPAFYRS